MDTRTILNSKEEEKEFLSFAKENREKENFSFTIRDSKDEEIFITIGKNFKIDAFYGRTKEKAEVCYLYNGLKAHFEQLRGNLIIAERELNETRTPR